MKRKLRVGVLTSLLLTPAALANAEEVENNHSKKPLNDEINPASQKYSNAVAATVIKDEILSNVKNLNEKSSIEAITLAESYTLDASFSAEEKAFIEAKIKYVRETNTQLTDMKLLGADISKLTLTNPKLIQNTKIVKTKFDSTYEKMKNTQSAFKVAVAAAPNEVKMLVLGSALQYGNDDAANYAFLKANGADIKVLLDMNEVIVEPENTVEKFVDLENEVNATSPDHVAVKQALLEARTAFENLNDNEKKVAIAHIPDNATTAPYKTYASLLTNLVAAEKVDASIQQFITQIQANTSAADFMKLILPVDTAFKKLNASAQSLLENKNAFKPYQEAYTVSKLIQAMRISNKAEYRTSVQYANGLYTNLAPNMQSYVVGADKLPVALQEIIEAEKVEAQISAIANLTDPVAKVQAIKAARTQYNALGRNEKRIVNNLTTLSSYERMLSAPLRVDALITPLRATNKDFETKTFAAQAAFNKLTAEEKKMVLNSRSLEILLPYAELLKEVNSLKSTMPNYKQAIAAAISKLTVIKDVPADASETIKPGIVKLVADLEIKLNALENEEKTAAQLVTDIGALSEIDKANFMSKLQIARTTYNALSPDVKKLVTNIKILTDFEKAYKPVSNVMLLIEKLDNTSTDYVKKVTAAKAAYDKLTAKQKEYVSNYSEISNVLPLVDVIAKIDQLKITAKNYRELATAARSAYTTLATANPTLLPLVNNYVKLVEAEGYIAAANAFDKKIEDLVKVAGDKFVEEAAKLTVEYKKLDTNVKKLVQNANTLTNYEKENKAVIAVINLIAKLDPTAKDYAKKVLAARKAFNALDPVSQKRVTNIDALTSVEDIASLIALIDTLKPTSKTFLKDLQYARKTYDALPVAKQAKITNYDVLVEAEQQLVGASAVIALIDNAKQGDIDYLEKIVKARVAYDKLHVNQKKLVTNYKDLTDKEKDAKPILAVMVLIESLSPESKDFTKKTAAARDAYLKLTKDQKSLVSNISTLDYYEPIAKVIDLISTLKSSSKTYHIDTVQARKLYNALTVEKQAYVTNYYLLQAAEESIKGAAHVDALILGLSSVDTSEFIQKLNEVRAAYNALPADQKRAVQNYKTLQDHEKMILPVKKVVDLIDGIFTAKDMATQYAQVLVAYDKLTSEQRKYVYNDQKLLSLTNVIEVYKSIAALRPSDKNYFGMIESVRRDYDSLSVIDKQRVGNYDVLLAAEKGMADVKKVVNAIAALSSSSNTYFEDVERVLQLYKALDSKIKIQVINYPVLQAAERNITAAKKVIQLIAVLDPEKLDFETKLIAAKKAYDILTLDQQKLVSNARMLEDYLNGN